MTIECEYFRDVVTSDDIIDRIFDTEEVSINRDDIIYYPCEECRTRRRYSKQPNELFLAYRVLVLMHAEQSSEPIGTQYQSDHNVCVP